jgi:hypothetical protein
MTVGHITVEEFSVGAAWGKARAYKAAAHLPPAGAAHELHILQVLVSCCNEIN